MAFAIVTIQNIRLSIFVQLAVDDQQPVFEPWGYHQLSLDHVNIDLPAVSDVVSPIVCHIQVQRPVPINVRQRQRHTPEFARRARSLGRVGKFSLPVV